MSCHSKRMKSHIVVSDLEPTLSLTSSGLALSRQVGVSGQRFEQKIATLHEQNLVQPGAELACLLLHDPEYQSRVRKVHLEQAGKAVVLRRNVRRVVSLLKGVPLDKFHFDFHVISFLPQELVVSGLEGVIPSDHIHGTEMLYDESGRVRSVICVNAGYGKVAVLESLKHTASAGFIYLGGSRSDVHAMLYVNAGKGLTIATSEEECIVPIAKYVVPADDALGFLPPILQEVVGWGRAQMDSFLAEQRVSA